MTARHVAGGENDVLIVVLDRDEQLSVELESLQDAVEALGLVVGQREAVENDDGAILDALGEGAPEGELLDLGVDLDGETARLGAENTAAMTPNRAPDAAGAGATEAFLTEGLLAAAGDFAPGFRAGGPALTSARWATTVS
jgi:hypothetical protein